MNIMEYNKIKYIPSNEAKYNGNSFLSLRNPFNLLSFGCHPVDNIGLTLTELPRNTLSDRRRARPDR